tara:strand:+ start:171 stop:1406 length:1236 start_codon:yes stop_codon:yes gene_type:complete
MMHDIKINIENISSKEKIVREEYLKIFNKDGFPSKKLEEWKFTDFKKIINNNFKEIKTFNQSHEIKSIEKIEDLEHNFIFLINGFLKSYDFKFEDEKNIAIKELESVADQNIKTTNPLINLNNALFSGGYSLEISKNYKLKKPLIVYNYFLGDLKNKITNSKNLIVLNDNSNLDLIEVNTDFSKNNFIYNNYTNIKIKKNSSFNNYSLQGSDSNGYFYKFVKVTQDNNSNYKDYIFTSGLKFNKIEENIDINGEHANCNIQSALFLDNNSHQEIKTELKHLKPNSNSYQKIKNVLNKNSKGVYQGKIYVKDIAQKTDAYQLSKALLLQDSSEFNAKPELEIYADDVKCSHGSTSGSINEDSIYYLMTRGISKKDATDLLTRAFFLEIAESISNTEIKKFIEKNLDRQIYGH